MGQTETETRAPKTVADVLAALDEAAERYLRTRGGQRKRDAAHALRKTAKRLYAVERQEAASR